MRLHAGCLFQEIGTRGECDCLLNRDISHDGHGVLDCFPIRD